MTLIQSAHQHQLWQANLQVAARLVNDYCYNPVLSQDALQEAQLALWEATFNWQESMEGTFTHYAWMHMRRKLLTYLTQTASDQPKLSRRERQVLNELKKHLRAGELISCQLLEALSQETGITRFRLGQLVSYWYQNSITISASSFQAFEELEAIEPEPETDISTLEEGIANLPEREKLIVLARHLQDPRATLADLATKFGVSIERVRQLESSAIKKLRKHLAEHPPKHL